MVKKEHFPNTISSKLQKSRGYCQHLLATKLEFYKGIKTKKDTSPQPLIKLKNEVPLVLPSIPLAKICTLATCFLTAY